MVNKYFKTNECKVTKQTKPNKNKYVGIEYRAVAPRAGGIDVHEGEMNKGGQLHGDGQKLKF